MSEQQGGVSPATAGGASAPIIDLSAFEEAGRFLATAWIAQAQARGAYLSGLLAGLSATPEPDAEAIASEPDPRDAEIEQLRQETRLLYKRLDRDNQQARDHAEGRSRRYSEVRDRIYRALGEEPPAVLGLWADLAKQVDRLIDTLTVEVAQHDRTKTDLERANEQAIKATAERNDLRAELDSIALHHASGLTVLLKDFTGAVNGLMPKPTNEPAEPRRWVAGDPEPEVGTTVTWGLGGSHWSRHEDRGWRSDACDCESCLDAAGLPWHALLDAAASSGGLVEVVSTDG